MPVQKPSISKEEIERLSWKRQCWLLFCIYFYDLRDKLVIRLINLLINHFRKIIGFCHIHLIHLFEVYFNITQNYFIKIIMNDFLNFPVEILKRSSTNISWRYSVFYYSNVYMKFPLIFPVILDINLVDNGQAANFFRIFFSLSNLSLMLYCVLCTSIINF